MTSSFFFNDTATTDIYTFSLHDALPIFSRENRSTAVRDRRLCKTLRHSDMGTLLARRVCRARSSRQTDRKSTRLNSSHVEISYAVFCLKKKKRPNQPRVDKFRVRTPVEV